MNPYGRPQVNMTGRRSGRLTVTHQSSEWRPKGHTYWACQCDCGQSTIVRADVLRSRSVKSCGCLQRQNNKRLMALVNAEASDDWNALLDTLCEVIDRFPRRPLEIRQALQNTWGECGGRRFQRALRTLVEQGRVVRTGRPQCSGDDDPSMYAIAPVWPRNLASCIAEAAAAWAVLDLGVRRAA